MRKRRIVLYFSIVLNLFLVSVVGYWCHQRSNVANYWTFRNSVSRTVDNVNVEEHSVCFVGNSITANWKNLSPEFFSSNNFINKGVGGQTSTQILLRFQRDIVSIKPSIVILNVGINDIGEGDGFYNMESTIENIESMIDICRANNINLVLTSILPATEIYKNRFTKVKLVQKKIEDLNIEIGKLVNRNGLKYVDYNIELKNVDGTFNEMYTFDGVHPNEKGYRIMERNILEVIEQIRNRDKLEK